MAGLASDVDLGVAGGEPPSLRIVVLPDVRRVALGAHVVPVLARARPVQLVPVVHVLARVEVEPALPALGPRARVPGDGERLQPAVGELDQILLERSRSERVLDVVVVERAVGAIGPHHELAVPAREGRGDAGVAEPGILEVAGDGRVGRRLHGEVVVRSPPALLRLLVALPADPLPDVARGRVRRWRCAGERCPRLAPRVPPPAPGDDGEDGNGRAHAQHDLPEASPWAWIGHSHLIRDGRRLRRRPAGSGRLPTLSLAPTHCSSGRPLVTVARSFCRRDAS